MLFESIKNLEYRGYDSCGLAVIDHGQIELEGGAHLGFGEVPGILLLSASRRACSELRKSTVSIGKRTALRLRSRGALAKLAAACQAQPWKSG